MFKAPQNDPIWAENAIFRGFKFIICVSHRINLRTIENLQKSFAFGLVNEKIRLKCKSGQENIATKTIHAFFVRIYANLT